MTMTRTMTNEQDVRLNLLNTLLTTPHRELAKVWPVHREMVAADPRFYVRLGAWYNDHGDVRDHKEMFVVTLVLSDFPGHRAVGLALLRQMPPYQVARVLDFIHGRKTTRKVPVGEQPKGAKGAKKAKRPKKQARTSARVPAAQVPRAQPGIVGRVVNAVLGRNAPAPVPTSTTEAAPAQQPTAPVQYREVTEEFGLFRNPPRSLRTEIERYLREREADAEWFDGSVLVARKAVKRLYALNHIKPGERAQNVLFDEDPPRDSRLFALRMLSKADSPEAQARAIVEHAIPYRVASTVVWQMTPTVLLALIDRMSPQELINNVAALKKRGALDNPELKALVGQKLEQARDGTGGGQRVSAFKAAKAVEAAGASIGADVRERLEGVADARVKAKGRIQRPTALLIDKSGSMTPAIELGKRIGAMLSAVCERELYVYAFDTMAYPIEVPFDPAQGKRGDDLASWERSVAGITASGGTSAGAAVESMRVKKQYVEQIILVTDEEENTAPTFTDALARYRAAVQADPNVCIVRLGHTALLETRCRQAGVAVDVFQFGGDYYALPNLVPLLSKPSKLELLMEIMDYPLPVRKSA